MLDKDKDILLTASEGSINCFERINQDMSQGLWPQSKWSFSWGQIEVQGFYFIWYPFKLVVLNSSLVIRSPFDLRSLSFLHFGKKQSASNIASLSLFFEGWINSFSTGLGDSQLFSMSRKFLSSLSFAHCFSFFF